MADKEDELEEKPKKGKSIVKILLIVVLPMLLIGGTVAGLYFGGVIGGGDQEIAEAGEDGEEGEEGEEGEGEGEEGEDGPAIYVALDPAFVVNFADAGGAKFLQITVEVMTRDPAMEGHVKTHTPAIRNNLVLLFSSQTSETVSSLEGKEALREETLSTIQEILEAETGDPGIEAVYFTSFVMQ